MSWRLIQGEALYCNPAAVVFLLCRAWFVLSDRQWCCLVCSLRDENFCAQWWHAAYALPSTHVGTGKWDV
jgi:hypothetical protein